MALAAGLAVTGCSADAPASPPPATVEVTEQPTPTVEPAESAAAEVCVYGPAGFNLVLRAWDRVTASRGASDHAEMVEGLIGSTEAQQDYETEGCVGSVESASFMFELSLLNAELIAVDESDDETYEILADAGNAWLDAVGSADGRFTPTYEG